MEVDEHNLDRREASLTVARGSVSTVLAHWDRLDERMKKRLLEAAMSSIENLVVCLEEDVAPLRRLQSS
ncbi:MAG TPA: hypothetical protein VG929_08945 [Actinomycetota bacterium]|nr:hypothetical protein [Actinomycetota bacterium]